MRRIRHSTPPETRRRAPPRRRQPCLAAGTPPDQGLLRTRRRLLSEHREHLVLSLVGLPNPPSAPPLHSMTILLSPPRARLECVLCLQSCSRSCFWGDGWAGQGDGVGAGGDEAEIDTEGIGDSWPPLDPAAGAPSTAARNPHRHPAQEGTVMYLIQIEGGQLRPLCPVWRHGDTDMWAFFVSFASKHS